MPKGQVGRFDLKPPQEIPSFIPQPVAVMPSIRRFFSPRNSSIQTAQPIFWMSSNVFYWKVPELPPVLDTQVSRFLLKNLRPIRSARCKPKIPFYLMGAAHCFGCKSRTASPWAGTERRQRRVPEASWVTGIWVWERSSRMRSAEGS